MSRLLSIDPGLNSGIALGYFDAITPYRLLDRWQVHDGVPGFLRWSDSFGWTEVDVLVVEKFILDPSNNFTADLTPVALEGVIQTVLHERGIDLPIAWQPRTDKAILTGYPKTAVKKVQRQRVRFNFLKRFGLFVPGTENDDSNDAVCHALIYLKKTGHYATAFRYWPPRVTGLAPVTHLPTAAGF